MVVMYECCYCVCGFDDFVVNFGCLVFYDNLSFKFDQVGKLSGVRIFIGIGFKFGNLYDDCRDG